MTVQPDSDGAPVEEPSVITGAHGLRLARRLIGNYFLQTIILGLRVVEQFLLIPLYMFAWGIDLYRDWLVLSAAIFFVAMFTFGIEDYFGNMFLHNASVGDWNGVRRQVRMALLVASTISLVMLSTLVILLLAVPLPEALSLSTIDSHTAVLIVIVMTPAWIGYPAIALHSVYRAYGDFSRGEVVMTMQYVTQLVLVATALALRQPPIVVALCYGAMSLLASCFIAIDVSRRYREVTLGFALPSREELRRIVSQSLLYFTNPLSTALTQNATLMLFGLFDFGGSVVVSFNVFRVLTGLTRQLGAQSFTVGTGIEMARQYAQQNRDACQRLYALTGRIVSCIAGVLCGLTIPFSAPFVAMWTHGAVVGDLPLVLCFLVGIFLGSPGRASFMLLRYSNQAHAIAWASCAYSMGGLLLSLALLKPLGVVGMAAAFAITETLAIGIYPPLVVARLFGFSALRHLGVSYLVGACAFVLSYEVAHWLFAAVQIGPVALATRAALWGALVLPPCALLVLPRGQRIALTSFLRRRLMPRKLVRG